MKAILIKTGDNVSKYNKDFPEGYGEREDRLAIFKSYERYVVGCQAFRDLNNLLEADIYIIIMHNNYTIPSLNLPKDKTIILDCVESGVLKIDRNRCIADELENVDYILASRQHDLDYFNNLCPEKVITLPHVENVELFAKFNKREKQQRIVLWAKHNEWSDLISLIYAYNTGLPVHVVSNYPNDYMDYYFDALSVEATSHDIMPLEQYLKFIANSQLSFAYRPTYDMLSWGHAIPSHAMVGTPTIGTGNVYAQRQLYPDLIIDSYKDIADKIELAQECYDDIIGYAQERAFELFSIKSQQARLKECGIKI